MVSRLPVSLFFAIVLHLLPSISHASERHALVIGNSEYKILDLKNPVNDATDMAAQLQTMGYKLFSDGPLLDLDLVSMESALQEFAESLPTGASAVFYYAGHGIANEHDNYLLPINSNLKSQFRLKDKTIGLRSIVRLLSTYNTDGVNVLLLDACRNNPLTRSFRGSQPGLQQLNGLPRSMFIGYAAESGKVASDNVESDNGTYTGQLLESMEKYPQLEIDELHEVVANTVYEKTNGDQFPVSEDSIYGDWCFVECQSSPVPTLPPVKPTEVDIAINPTRNYWKIVGGIALGLAVVALASEKDEPSPSQVGVLLDPPGQ